MERQGAPVAVVFNAAAVLLIDVTNVITNITIWMHRFTFGFKLLRYMLSCR
jgi:hypothetical protein